MNENLFGWDDGIWLLLDQMGILLGNFALLVALGGAVAGFVRREDLRAWLTRNHFPRIGGVSENTQWDGVVYGKQRERPPLGDGPNSASTYWIGGYQGFRCGSRGSGRRCPPSRHSGPWSFASG
jgi:hypothetical protein